MELMNNDEEETIDWLDLPFDLLAQITDKVISSFSLTDYLRFGCVCVQWRSFLIENNNYEQIKLSSSNLPLLLIPSLDMDHHHHTSYKKEHEMDNNKKFSISNYYDPKDIWRGLDYEQRHHSTRSFYSLSEGKVYDFQLPVPSYMNCRGSSHGWLVLVEECRDGTYPVHLFNPFRPSDHQKNNKIHLPPLTPTDPRRRTYMDSYNLTKVIFSRDPSSSSSSLIISNNPTTTSTTTNNDDDDGKLVVLGYHLGTMVFCRPGDEVWTPIPTPDHSPIVDVIFYEGRFWGILQDGSAVVFDISPKPKFTILVDPHPDDDSYPPVRYLVESAGDLFHVRRDYHYGPDDFYRYSTVGFQVFKLDPATMQWVKTNSLDDRMFFLGDNASMSVSVVDNFPEWCKPNSIYFTDDNYEIHCTRPWIGPHDIGVFNLQSRSFEPLYTMNSKPILPASPIMPSPIWIQPKP